MYDESKRERQRLHNQILSSDDSFGKIYNIVSRLEALAPDKIYNSAVHVIEDVLDVKGVYIYFLTKNQYYLRLISKSIDGKHEDMKSINLKDHPIVQQVVDTGEIYINKSMDVNLPTIIMPIANDDQVYSVIYIHKINFSQLDAYKVNLLKVVSSLITTSIGRAYLYESATDDERYVENTMIMKSDYFVPLVHDKFEQVQEHKNPVTLLKILPSAQDSLDTISQFLEKQLRDFDFVGMDIDQTLYILLSNTSSDEAKYVVDRFKTSNVNCKQIEEEEVYVIFNRTHHH
jgi:transcriptional regulator with GAF, ATPase, and Fis domain